jgi:hypothetical protein
MRNSGNAVVQLMASRDSSSRFFLKMAGLCHSDERERGLFPELLFDCYYLCERLSTAGASYLLPVYLNMYHSYISLVMKLHVVMHIILRST